MGLFTWLLIGAAVGFVAGLVSGKGAAILSIVLGAVSGGLGGFIATLCGLGAIGVFGWANLFIALGSAILIMAAWNIVQRTRLS